jgi:hypothetical protein
MRRNLLIASLLVTVAATGCGGNKKHNRGQTAAPASTATTGSGTIPNVEFNNNALISLAPDKGPPMGGTAVELTGTGFLPGTTVTFDGKDATDVVVVNEAKITCKTPPHPAGVVDVVVLIPSGRTGRLNNAFTYDASLGIMARVADHGDPSGEEQELVELMQRARKDPVAEAARINARHGTTLDFSSYPPTQPLCPNEFLSAAAKAHVDDMKARNFYGHANPDGLNANGRILATRYDLHTYFGTNPAVNLTENIGKGQGSAPGNGLTTAQNVHDTFLIDKNVPGFKHREMILGGGSFANRREVGTSYQHFDVSNPSIRTDFICEEFAVTKADKPFLVGVAFDDKNNDGICQAGEGKKNVTVTLSHASGFTISTTTKTAGGFGFEVFVDETYTLTIDGKPAQVVIAGKNKKVDLKGSTVVAQ